MKVVPNNLLRRDSGASQSTPQQGKHPTKLLEGSYQRGKGHLGGVVRDCEGQKPAVQK